MNRAKLHFVYFTCGKHFSSLFISLKSIARLRLEFVGRIFLFVDRDDFLTEEQIQLLNRFGLDVTAQRSRRNPCWGEEAAALEVESFTQLAGEVAPQDYITKTDSDIIFATAKTFLDVMSSGHDAYGQLVDYWKPVVFFQGGCYFIKGAMLPEFKNFDMSICRRLTAALNETERSKEPSHRDACPDEGIIYTFLKTKTENIALKQFMVSPYDLFNHRKNFSTIHYIRCKEKMTNFELFLATTVRNSLMKLGPLAGPAMLPVRAMRKASRLASVRRA